MKTKSNENDDVEAEPYRNPSPPPLTDAEKESVKGDLIGDTIFSKRWVLDVLLKLYKHEEDSIYTTLDKNTENGEKKQETKHESDNNEGNDENNERFLKDSFENDLCQLWDMTANTEVALFVNEHDSKSILLDALRQTQSPRLMEICFGILGNLFCVKEIGSLFSQDAEMRVELLSYLTVMDTLSLVELTRLLCTCLSCDSTSLLWVKDCCQGTHIENLCFLLKNTLNVTLLCHVVKILEIIFDDCEEPLDSFITDNFIDGIIEAFDPLNESGDRVEHLVALVHLLQLLSLNNKGYELISNKNDLLLHLFSKYYHLVDVNEGYEMTASHRLTIYASILSILDLMIPEHKDNISDKKQVFIRQSIEYLCSFLNRTDLQHGNTDFEILVLCIERLVSLMSKLENEEKNFYREDFQKLGNVIKTCNCSSEFLDILLKDIFQ